MLNRSLKIHKLGNSMSFPHSYSSFLTIPHASHVDPQQFSLLRRLDSCKSTQELKQVHSIIIKTNPSLQTHLIYTKIISISTTFHDPDPNYINSILIQIPNPDIRIYNSIIRLFSGPKNKNNLLIAFSFYQELLVKGLLPDNYTYPFLLKLCAESRALREGQEIHGHVVKNGLVWDLYVVNTLMRVYSVCGVIVAAQKLFDESPDRDMVSWTILIQGYVKMGFWKEGIRVFFEMCEADFRADGMTMVIVLSACANLGDLVLGRRIHEYMLEQKVNFDVFVGNALVDMYLKCGDAGFAHKVFNEMPVKNVVSWNSMISGLAQQGEFKEALSMFRKMQNRGVKPDDVTLVGVLNSCANLGMLELGKWVHAYVDRNRIKADRFIGNALVDMYAKCGSIDEAFKVFNGMKLRDVYTYTAIIVGLAMHGQGERALNLFSKMPNMGIEPDGVTYVGVLMACSHVGLVEEGRKHFAEMSRLYNLEPQTEHYGCMVDLLGRAGLINEAEEFIKSMPIEPDAFVWGALLGACRIHGKVELAEIVMEKLVKIEPDRDGAYILMSNIYSSANKWRDALKLRKDMKERKLKKIPGCSSIELDGVVHEFRKGDKTQRKTKEVYILLDQMKSHLKSSGQWEGTGEFS
ncbi:pentatricopeptide repeat-containing protein At1g08070, chloroplastic-like [Actinidia eriantha]|uniref:pentatricopeptide repeat-containing protein At1g08070, chloroplastic-like n=1 Tax=Actinidia eriantha TaxID=165200 RepID=UPI002590F608|nr:pentatricopeptide repeat-containing protein At1g08070, chloroplastic-like [Actinidia eriantha]